MIRIAKCGYVNVFLLIEGQQVVLIDTGLRGSSKKIAKALEALDLTMEDINLIVLTHGHSDHTGGLKEIQKVIDVPVMISGIEYDEMLNGAGKLTPYTFGGKVANKLIGLIESSGIKPSPIEGELIIADRLDLSDYGVSAEVIPCPGHTPGSLAVVTEAGEAIIGDSLMAMMPWKGPGVPMIAWDMDKVKASVGALLDSGYRRFYLSHGGLFTRARMIGALRKLG